MTKSKLIKKIDFVTFLIIMVVTVVSFKDNGFSRRIDRFFLPEERNPGYYEILNNYEKSYISDKLYENGTKNLMVNALSSGERESGYRIDVNPDGSFTVSGSYDGESDIYEYPMGKDRRLSLPIGDYVLSDGGASSNDGISLRIVGVQHMRGGKTNYVTLACLPEQSAFHWNGDDNIELRVDMVVRPGFNDKNLEFMPMLLRTDDVSGDFQPCYSPSYDWNKDGTVGYSLFYEFNIPRGALDGETVTESDWSMFVNTLRYQMKAERAVIDLMDGNGIEFNKKGFPKAVYGKLDSSKRVRDGIEICITDFRKVIDRIRKQQGTELGQIRDFYDYLKALDSKDYIVLISISDEGVNALNHGSMELLQKLGIESNLIEPNKRNILRKLNLQNSYYAILKQGKVLEEKISEEKISVSGKLQNGAEYNIESMGATSGEEKASIKIYGKEYAMNLRGMNFVVYDEDRNMVVDSVCFDTCKGLWCHRQP